MAAQATVFAHATILPTRSSYLRSMALGVMCDKLISYARPDAFAPLVPQDHWVITEPGTMLGVPVGFAAHQRQLIPPIAARISLCHAMLL